MAAQIHPSSVVDGDAVLEDGVVVGPFCVVGPGVRLGEGTVLQAHCHLAGPMRVGRNNRFFPFCTVGMETSDKKYRGETTELVMGDDNIVREYANLHRATQGATTVGHRNLIMPHSHVAHECTLGSDIVLGNGSALGGHVVVGDHATIGGLVSVHQHCRLGAHCFVGTSTGVRSDVPAWVSVAGSTARQRGLNEVGMQRLGRSTEQIRVMRRAVRILFDYSRMMAERQAELEKLAEDSSDVALLLQSVRESTRGLVR